MDKKWNDRMLIEMKQQHARLLSTRKELLAAWKLEFDGYEVWPPTGRSSFGPLYSCLIEATLDGQAVDYSALLEQCRNNVQTEVEND